MANVYVIEEGTTNLAFNPSLEVNTIQWAASDADIERTSEKSYSGDFSLKATATGSLPRPQTWTNLPEGVEVTVSAWVYHELGVDKIFNVNGGDSFTVNSGVWTRIHRTIVISSGGISYFQFRMTSATVGDIFYIDAAQIEAKPYATTYCDGSLGEGYSWTGIPHNSPSIREESSISMPSPEPESLYIRYSEDGEIWNNEYVSFEDKPEDIEPTLLLSPDGSYDREGEVTPTISGGVVEVDGEYGKAWQIAEPTTNLHTNPALGSGKTTGWITWQSTGATYESGVDTSFNSLFPAWAKLKITNSLGGATALAGMRYSIESITGSVTASLWIAVSRQSTYRLRLLVNREGEASIDNLITAELGPTPTRVSVTFDMGTSTNLTRLDFGFGWAAGHAYLQENDTIWVSGGQIESKPYATPYCDGSLGAGHAWTGEPHASTSTREGAAITYPVDWNMKDGSFLMRMRNTGEGPLNGYVLNIGQWGTQQNLRVLAPGSSQPTMRMRSGAELQSTIYYDTGTVNYLWLDPTTLYGEWLELKHRFKAGDGALLTANRIYTEAPNAVQLMIGSPSQPAQMEVESALFFDTPLTEAEITRLIELDEIWTWEEATGFKVTADLGQHAKIRYVDNNLKLLTNKKLYIGTVIGFSRPLSEKEVEILNSTPLEYISGKTLLNLPETTVGVSQLL